MIRVPVRGAGAFAAALFLWAQLGGAVQLAAVSHVACLEHGELVELHGTHGEKYVGAAHAPTIDSDATAARSHDHCTFGTVRREASTPRLAHGSLHRPRLAIRQRVYEAIAPLAPIDLLRLAPKSSPPA